MKKLRSFKWCWTVTPIMSNLELAWLRLLELVESSNILSATNFPAPIYKHWILALCFLCETTPKLRKSCGVRLYYNSQNLTGFFSSSQKLLQVTFPKPG